MTFICRTIRRRHDRVRRRKLAGLLALLILTGLFELAGVAMILPRLAVMPDPGIVASDPILSRIHAFFGFSVPSRFLQFLGFAVFLLIVVGINVRRVTFSLTNRSRESADVD